MGTGKTKQTTQQTKLPQYLNNAYKGVIKAGAKTAAAPLQQYTEPRVAGFTPDQESGFGMIRNSQGAALPYYNSASSMYGNVGNMDWGATMDPTVDYGGLNAASGAVMPGVDQYDNATMAQYMDPYMQQMIDPIMQRMQQEDAKQISSLKGSGISMGLSPALGDRMGLAASDLSGQQALSRNQTLGQLMSQGFQNAQGQLNAQQQLQLQGGTSDQQRLMEAQSLMQQGRQGDANRILQSLSSQQSGQLGAAQGMQGLGSDVQQSLYQGIDYLMNSGQMQQQQGQQQLDNAYSDWQERNNYPKSQVDWLANLVYGSPGKGASSTTTTEPGPSILSQLLGLGTTAVGLGRTWGSSTGGRIAHRDLGGAVVPAPFTPRPYNPPPPVVAPMIDAGMFRVAQGTPSSAPAGPGLNLGGQSYINALTPLTEEMLGATEDLTTRLPKYVRRPFKQIARGIKWKDKKESKKKAIGGGLLPDTDEPLPGTPEYDAALAARLAGPSTSSTPARMEMGEDAPTDLGGAPMSHKRSRVGEFFSNIDPLVYMGLGIMGGESPFPLTNVGQGGAGGLKLAQDLYASELDDKPMVDDSGPTVRYWTAGEGWVDSGIPSYKWASATTSKTDGTEKERLMEGKYGPQWRANPKAIEEFETLLKTPNTLIDMKGSSKYSEGMGTNFADYTKEVMITNPVSAQTKAQDYAVIAGLLSNPDVYSGTAGPAINQLKKAAGTLFGLNVEGVADAEVADMTKKAAIGGIRDILKGPMSDGDRKTIEAIIPGLETSPEGVQLAAEIAKMNADSAETKAEALGNIIRKHEGELTQEAYMEYRSWLKANPVFTKEALIAAQARAKAAATTRGPMAGTDDALGALKKKWGLQ